MGDFFADRGPPEPETPVTELVAEKWNAIKHYRRRMRVMTFLNIRLWQFPGIPEDPNVWERVRTVFNELGTSQKVNYAYGFILEHKTEGTLRYYHTSPNHNAELDRPVLVRTEEELRAVCRDAERVDVVERAARTRPNTQWKVLVVTNMSFFFYSLNNAGRIGHPPAALPAHLAKKTCVGGLLRPRGSSTNYKDNLCFFRCLAMFIGCGCAVNTCKCGPPKQNETYKLFSEYIRVSGAVSGDARPKGSDFAGVSLGGLLEIERLFDVSVVVFEHDKSDTPPSVVWCSGRPAGRRGKKMYVVLCGDHFCYVKNVLLFSGLYSCNECNKTFSRVNRLTSHICDPRQAGRLVFENAAFGPPDTHFDKLATEVGIFLDDNDRRSLTNRFRITYDIECYLPTEELPADTPTMTHTREHKLLSISACSNVPGFENPACFVTDGDSLATVLKFVKYGISIAKAAKKINVVKWKPVLRRLKDAVDDNERREQKFADAGFSKAGTYARRRGFAGLKKRILGYARRVPLVGFNSQRYDLNVIKGELVKSFGECDEEIDFVIKRPGTFPCIQTRHFRVLDILNFVAPGFTYAKYLKAFGCAEAKGFFPYEWMDSLEKLNATSLPPRECFYSSLKELSIGADDYAFCQQVWRDQGMTTFKDFLVWYNNLDVAPFLKALDVQAAVYEKKNIDMLGSGVSLPGLAVRWAHASLTPLSDLVPRAKKKMTDEEVGRRLRGSQPILNTTAANADLYVLFREHLVGGPSIVFHRHQQAAPEATKLRPLLSDKECSVILGLDANSLYLWCIGQAMPTGHPVRRKSETGFAPELTSFSTAAHCWLSYIEFVDGVDVRHALNGGEHKVGRHGLPVDGTCFATRTVYQFHGCYWHACHCTGLKGRHPTRDATCTEIRVETRKKDAYIRGLGWKLVIMRGCEWNALCAVNADAARFKKIFYSSLYSGFAKKMTPAAILSGVSDGSFYGFVECDIEVPDNLREKFADMAPIFKNVELDRSHLSPAMRSFAEANGHLSRPQRTLVGSLFGKRVLLHTALLKWYLSHGLVVSKIYQTVQYLPRAVFQKFADEVSDARRQSDSDPSKSIVGDTSKLVGNSLYGKTITNKEKHRRVDFWYGSVAASTAIGSSSFASLEELNCDVFEVHRLPAQIKIDIATHIGFTILQLAKLRMLQFYFDFIEKYISRSDFTPMGMDTDSMYMALSGELERVVKTHLKQTFYETRFMWFPTEACPQHHRAYVSARVSGARWEKPACCVAAARYSRRTPGLFKEEYKGHGMIALNSKTYCCWRNDDSDIKVSSKGLSKRTNKLTVATYRQVLFGKTKHHGVNKGFVYKKGKMYSYEQIKTGLTWFYAKRLVGCDGVSTSNIAV